MKVEIKLDDVYIAEKTIDTLEYINDLYITLNILNHISLEEYIQKIETRDYYGLLYHSSVAMVDNNTLLCLLNIADICSTEVNISEGYVNIVSFHHNYTILLAIQLYGILNFFEKQGILGNVLSNLNVPYRERKDIINYLLKTFVTPSNLFLSFIPFHALSIANDVNTAIEREARSILRLCSSFICELINNICR